MTSDLFRVEHHGGVDVVIFPSGRKLFVAPDDKAEFYFIHDGNGHVVWDGFSQPDDAFAWLEEQERMFPEIPVLEPVTTEVRTLTAPEFADAVRRHEEAA